MFANKDFKYPPNLSTLMDVMRQQPLTEKKKVTTTTNFPEKEKEKNKEGKGASSYATTKDGKGDYNYFCCRSNK